MVDKFDIKKIKWLKGYKGTPSAYFPLKTPSVSVILDLIPDPDWLKFIEEIGEEKALEIRTKAQQRGKALHAFLEHFINSLVKSKDPSMALQHTQKVSVPILENEGVPMEKIDKGREMFFNFYYSSYVNLYTDLIGTELALYSPFLFYRGKADVFYNEKGVGRVVTDFKGTTSTIEKDSIKELKYKRQLGAYALALEHMFKEKELKISKASILAIHSKTPTIQEITCIGNELEEQKKEFEILVKQWHKDNNQEFLFSSTL